MPDGPLVPRDCREALLHNPEEAADRVFGMLRDDKVRGDRRHQVPVQTDTICVHGDTPDAVRVRARAAQMPLTGRHHDRAAQPGLIRGNNGFTSGRKLGRIQLAQDR
jgi:hypothetical protein